MTDSNSDERAFWNEAPGRTWVERQQILDELHSNVLTLVLEAARLSPGERVLDIGCGAGATTVAAARAVGPEGSVLALDISEPLAERARAYLAEEGLAHARVEVMDVQTGRPEAPPVDCCLSRFGVMFFDDPVAGFANIRSLIRPDGRLAFATWADARLNPWFSHTLDAAVERLGRPPAGDPDAPGPLAFRNPERVRDILDDAGFRSIRVDEVATTLPVSAGLEAAVALTRHIGPGARVMRLQGGTDDDLVAILDGVRERFSPFLGPDGLAVPARVNLVTATA